MKLSNLFTITAFVTVAAASVTLNASASDSEFPELRDYDCTISSIVIKDSKRTRKVIARNTFFMSENGQQYVQAKLETTTKRTAELRMHGMGYGPDNVVLALNIEGEDGKSLVSASTKLNPASNKTMNVVLTYATDKQILEGECVEK